MWLSFIVHMCKMIITPGSFFIFFKILIFWVVKGKKTVQNDKKFFPLHSMSQEQYIIWLSFMIHVCKMIISSGVFLYFHNLIFWVHRGVKGQKTVQNDKKFCLLHSISQKRYIIWLSFMVQMWKMTISPGAGFKLAGRNSQFVKGFGSLQMNFCIFSKNCESLKSDTSYIWVIHWTSYIVSYFKPIKYPLLNNNLISQKFIVHINFKLHTSFFCNYHFVMI